MWGGRNGGGGGFVCCLMGVVGQVLDVSLSTVSHGVVGNSPRLSEEDQPQAKPIGG